MLCICFFCVLVTIVSIVAIVITIIVIVTMEIINAIDINRNYIIYRVLDSKFSGHRFVPSKVAKP